MLQRVVAVCLPYLWVTSFQTYNIHIYIIYIDSTVKKISFEAKSTQLVSFAY